MQKGTTKTIKGKEYKDVIVVEYKTSYKFVGITDLVVVDISKNYFAKGVGFIYQESSLYDDVYLDSFETK